MDILKHLISRFFTKEFLRFAVVGGASTVLNYAVFYLLYSAGVLYLVASGIGYITGTLFGFVFNKIWSFKSQSTKIMAEAGRYFIIYGISLILGLLLLRVVVEVGVAVLIGNVLSIGLTTITNFLGSKYFAFKHELRISSKSGTKGRKARVRTPSTR